MQLLRYYVCSFAFDCILSSLTNATRAYQCQCMEKFVNINGRALQMAAYADASKCTAKFSGGLVLPDDIGVNLMNQSLIST